MFSFSVQHSNISCLVTKCSTGTDVSFWIDYGDGYVEEFYFTDPDAFVVFNHTYPATPATYDVEVVATNDR